MRSRRQFLIVAAAFGGALALPAAAGGPGGGALEITQLANLAELSAQTVDIAEGVGQRVEMITNQIQQIQVALQSYQNMVANTLSLPAQIWSPVAGSLQQLHEAVGQGQALAYTIANVDDVIRQEFSQYGDYLENPLSLEQYGERYRNWSRRNLETTSATMNSVGLNIAQIGSEEEVMAVLRGQNTNNGRTQLLQVGNQVAIEQVAQFQKLRQLVASNTQMMGAYFSKSEAIRDAQNASTDLYYNTPPVLNPTDGQRFQIMKFSLRTAAAVLAAATILITVTKFIATPEMPVDPTTASSPPGIQDPTVQKKTIECGAIQARIDAAGQPGWDGLAPELQSDIRQATACTFVGDAKKF